MTKLSLISGVLVCCRNPWKPLAVMMTGDTLHSAWSPSLNCRKWLKYIVRKLTVQPLWSVHTVLLLSTAVICQIIFCTVFKNSCNCRWFCLDFFTFIYTLELQHFQNWHLAYWKKKKKKRFQLLQLALASSLSSLVFFMWVSNQVVLWQIFSHSHWKIKFSYKM